MMPMRCLPVLLLAGLGLVLAGCGDARQPVLSTAGKDEALVVPANSWEDSARIVAGEEHSCVLWQGKVQCWGRNTHGQLQVPAGLDHVTDISAGESHTCALADGHVTCWGRNDSGQATPPPGLAGVTTISAGYLHSCAVSGGHVVCWGNDQLHQTEVPATLEHIEMLVSGLYDSCASTGQDVYCWGAHARANQPLHLSGIHNPVAMSLGTIQACVIHSVGLVCHNIENDQVMGNVPQLFEPVSVRSYGIFSCATVPGNVACWDFDGRVNSPRISGEALDVAVGGKHFCVLMQGRHITCWARTAIEDPAAILTPPAGWGPP